MSDHLDQRGRRPPPGFRFAQWGALPTSGLGAFLIGLHHNVVGAILLVFGVLYVFVVCRRGRVGMTGD